ncbi:MAG: DUF362 domain-containing protein [Dehalococcoidia bacterium]|nr:MAG: DUF362 domain-containing protein [Dehalococcoidia bacterium]
MASVVWLQETCHREHFIQRVLENEVGEPNAKSILIKPNIVCPEGYPSTTHQATLRSVLQYFLPYEKEILVADGPAFDAGDSKEIIQSHALKVVCDELGVELVDLSSGEFTTVRAGDYDLEMSSIPFEFDFLVSLPVLKSHFVCDLTGALKNQFGFLSPKQKRDAHFHKDVHRVIAQLNTIIKPHFYIVDAVETLVGAQEVRHGGKPRALGYMLASRDPLSLDIVGLELLKKVEPRLQTKSYVDIAHVKHAKGLGIGQTSYTIRNLD